MVTPPNPLKVMETKSFNPLQRTEPALKRELDSLLYLRGVLVREGEEEDEDP